MKRNDEAIQTATTLLNMGVATIHIGKEKHPPVNDWELNPMQSEDQIRTIFTDDQWFKSKNYKIKLKDEEKTVVSSEKSIKGSSEYGLAIMPGIHEGFSKAIVGIDGDYKPDQGINGYETLAEWQRKHGPFNDTASDIVNGVSPHYYFLLTEEGIRKHGLIGRIRNLTQQEKSDRFPGVDIRWTGGCIICAPTRYPDGRVREWEYEPQEYGFQEANESVYQFLLEYFISLDGAGASGKTGNHDKERRANNLIQLKDGESRERKIYEFAFQMARDGYLHDTIRLSAEAINNQFQDPLDQTELDHAIESGLSYYPEVKDEDVRKVFPVPDPETGHPRFELNNNGELKQSLNNIVEAIEYDPGLAGHIKLNELAHAPCKIGPLPWDPSPLYREWTNSDDANNRLYLENTYGLTNKERIADALTIVTKRHSFNPVRDLLDDIRVRVPLVPGSIRKLPVEYLGVEDTEYNFAVMRLWMLGAISRAYRPGCKFDHMIMLVGDQGIGKSEFLKKYAMRQEFHSELGTIEGDATLEKLRGFWIIEMPELSALRKAKDVESIKSFLTITVDRYRPKYERRVESYPRMCVFAGTTNDIGFLTDKTGNRRVLPVTCRKAYIKKSLFGDQKAVRMDFLLAWREALDIYDQDPDQPLIMPADLMDEVLKAQEERQMDDPAIGMIQSYLDGLGEFQEYTCALQLYYEALQNITVDYRAPLFDRPFPEVPRYKINEIHQIMQTSIKGWEPCGKQRCGKPYGVQRAYRRIPEGKPEGPDPGDQKPEGSPEAETVTSVPDSIEWETADWETIAEKFGDPKEGTGLW